MAEAVEIRVQSDDLATINRDAGSADGVGVYVEGVKTGLVTTIKQTTGLDFDDFTDNADATGYVDLTTQLPAGAIPLGWRCTVATGFTGDTTAVIQVGVSGDLNRFSADTAQSVLAAATVGASSLAADACDGMNAAQTIRLTVTGGADFTSIAAGSISEFELLYISNS